jgi:hypothetical protein
MPETEALPDGAFKTLMGRVPSEEERQRLTKVRDALGIRSADAIWEVMIALDHHFSSTRPFRTRSVLRRARPSTS